VAYPHRTLWWLRWHINRHTSSTHQYPHQHPQSLSYRNRNTANDCSEQYSHPYCVTYKYNASCVCYLHGSGPDADDNRCQRYSAGQHTNHHANVYTHTHSYHGHTHSYHGHPHSDKDTNSDADIVHTCLDCGIRS